jgi:hypothetical protein
MGIVMMSPQMIPRTWHPPRAAPRGCRRATSLLLLDARQARVSQRSNPIQLPSFLSDTHKERFCRGLYTRSVTSSGLAMIVTNHSPSARNLLFCQGAVLPACGLCPEAPAGRLGE